MRKYTLVYFLVSLSFNLSATSIVDSLRHQLAQQKENDQNKAHLLNLLAWELQYEEPDQAIERAKEAQLIAQRINVSEEEAFSANLIGLIQKRRGDYDKALESFLEALAIRERAGDTRGVGRSLNNIGSVLKSQGKYADALQYYERSLAIRQKNQDPDWAATAYNMGNLMAVQGEFEQAIVYGKQSLTGYQESGDSAGMADCYEMLGNYYNELEQYAEASSWYLQALTLFQLLEDSYSTASLLLNIGGLKQNQTHFTDAITYYKQALNKAMEFQDTEMLLQLYDNLLYCYEQEGQLSEALAMSRQLQALKDSVYNEASIQALEDVKAKYETEKQEQANKLLTAKNQQQRSQNGLLVALAAILLLIVVGLGWSYRQKQRLTLQQEQLHKQEVKGLLQQQELRSLDAMMEGQENERKRIAQELHDRLGSMLATIKLHFSALESKLDEQVQQQEGQNQQLNHLLDEACEEVRRVSHNMESGALRQFGLVAALDDLVDQINSSGKIAAELVTHDLAERMDMNLEITLYRIIQELLSNTLKHAQAKEISLQLTQRSDQLNLVVEDNGKGFKPNSQDAVQGMGMKNIATRVKQLQGTWNIDSTPGKGTTVIVEIPV